MAGKVLELAPLLVERDVATNHITDHQPQEVVVEDSGDSAPHWSMLGHFSREFDGLKIKAVLLEGTELTLVFSPPLSPERQFRFDKLSHLRGVDLDGYLVGIVGVDSKSGLAVGDRELPQRTLVVVLQMDCLHLKKAWHPRKIRLETRHGKFEIPGV